MWLHQVFRDFEIKKFDRLFTIRSYFFIRMSFFDAAFQFKLSALHWRHFCLLFLKAKWISFQFKAVWNIFFVKFTHSLTSLLFLNFLSARAAKLKLTLKRNIFGQRLETFLLKDICLKVSVFWDLLYFPKNHRKIWQISALDPKK